MQRTLDTSTYDSAKIAYFPKCRCSDSCAVNATKIGAPPAVTPKGAAAADAGSNFKWFCPWNTTIHVKSAEPHTN